MVKTVLQEISVGCTDLHPKESQCDFHPRMVELWSTTNSAVLSEPL